MLLIMFINYQNYGKNVKVKWFKYLQNWTNKMEVEEHLDLYLK